MRRPEHLHRQLRSHRLRSILERRMVQWDVDTRASRAQHPVQGNCTRLSLLPKFGAISGPLSECACCATTMQAVVHCIVSGTSHCPHIMHLLRNLFYLAVTHNFHVSAQHLPGIHNFIADSLSRFMLFATFLATTLKPQSIKVYLHGMRNLQLEHGFTDPLSEARQLRRLLRGIKRLKGAQPDTRLPITPSLLRAAPRAVLNPLLSDRGGHHRSSSRHP